MSNVVEERGQPKVLLVLLGQFELRRGNTRHARHDRQNPQTMRKTSVRGVRVGNVTEAELLQVPQPLKAGGIDYTTLEPSEFNCTVNRVNYDSIWLE